MAKCMSCGAEMEGKFCWKCGATAGIAPVLPFKPSSGGSDETTGLGVNGASALCYLFGVVTGLVFLLLAPYNRERQVRFHAFQSIFLSVAYALLQVGVTILALLLAAVNLNLGAAISSLHLVVSLAFFAGVLYLMWKSYQGVTVALPVIGELAASLAGGKGPESSTGSKGMAA